MRELVNTFKALSDETRLRILALLLARECCVCEVMQVLSISQTRASRNLNVLYGAGLLKQRKEGLWSLYSIDRAGKHYEGLVRALAKAFEGNSVIAADSEKLKIAERIGPGCSPQTKCCQPAGNGEKTKRRQLR